MSRSNSRIIGITLGDPSGIGAEVTAKALRKLQTTKNTSYCIIGDLQIFKRCVPRIPVGCTFVDAKTHYRKFPAPGRPTQETAKASLNYLDTAIKLLKTEKIHGLVTAPLSKEAICSLGISFHGHTEYLAEAFKIKKVAMMFVAPKLRTMIVTRHLAIKDVARAIRKSDIFEHISAAHFALTRYFHIRRPRIAVCGLNPHAGEGGTIGKEDQEKIVPAIRLAHNKGMNVAGPLAADTAFSPDLSKPYDVLIAMYHDQGLIPIKTLYFSKVVNLTIGLPFIRTSPAHGTAFDIAGKNKANPSSMSEAIRLAAQLT